MCAAVVGGFFRVVDGRSEGGGKVVGAVLFDIDEGSETLAVGLGDDCDQVGKLAAVVMQADAVAVSQDGAAEVDESAVEGVLPDKSVSIEEIKWIFGEAYVLKSRFTPGVFTVLFTPSEFSRLFTLRSST